jgi:hypothetical protein
MAAITVVPGRREVKKEAGLGGQPGKLLRDAKSLRHIT